jgi:N-methylhydantoinase B
LCEVASPDGGANRLPSKVTTDVGAEHVILTETPGGGGWGDPKRRDPDAVLRDVVAGLVSRERARDVYGVALTDGLAIDDEGTRELRAP